MASILAPIEGIPNIVLIGVPDQAALQRVLTKLAANQIPHYAWSEPDYDFGLTAIATQPLYDADRKILQNYRLWKFGRVEGKPSCSFNGDPATSSGVAQKKERQTFSLEVAGSTPAPGANFG